MMNGGAMLVAINAQLVSFSESYHNSGISRYTHRLVAGLSQGDDDNHYIVFVNARDRGGAADLNSDRMQVVANQWPTVHPAQRVMWEQVALPALLRRMRVDVFHAPANVLPMRVPCASVLTIHDLSFVHYPQFFRPSRRIYQRTFTSRSARAATRVIAVSQSTRSDLIAHFGIDPARIRVVYPAIESRYQPVADPARLAAFRHEHALPERFLLYLGNLEPRKNVEGLVEAYARLRADAPDTPPLVVAGGKGWFYETLFARVRTLGLERSVTFAGYVRDEEQPLWYAAAELFIYPSFFEGFGLPVVEAMACGTPVITSNVSSLPEVAGDVAVQVDPHDSAALAHAMRRLLQDDQTRYRLAAEGPSWARQFSTERTVRGCRDVYAEAAGVARQRQMMEVG
jgi:glycosyltransferase involved in cell wall biosynthesis